MLDDCAADVISEFNESPSQEKSVVEAFYGRMLQGAIRSIIRSLTTSV